MDNTSGTYTIWVYYHQLDEQTLYTCINDFVDFKLNLIGEDLTQLRNQSIRSSQEEKYMSTLMEQQTELKDFHDELLNIVKFWKPNLNDGVQINAAPLWKFFQHNAWQKKLKKTWDELENGKFDWSHMAYNIWPERVLKKCYQFHSIAIAHNVENELWEEVEVPAKRGKGTKLKWQPKQMTDTELNTYIQEKIANK